ncbi:MAG: DedA family protein [Calditrichia bacterium]|nr:DedA family protein [Calditrichia bacterium]
MVEFLENLFSQISPAMAYLILGVSAYTENVVPPIPGDTVVILGAYLVSTGQLDFWGVYVSTTIGSVAGFVTMYYIGRKFGRSFIYKKSRSRIFKEEDIRKAEIWFGKWGYWVIAANRFLTGTRSIISLFSGLFHLNILLVVALSIVSAAIWNGLLISAGMLVGKNWEIISDIISQYNKILIVLTICVIGYVIYRKYYKKKSEQKPEG